MWMASADESGTYSYHLLSQRLARLRYEQTLCTLCHDTAMSQQHSSKSIITYSQHTIQILVTTHCLGIIVSAHSKYHHLLIRYFITIHTAQQAYWQLERQWDQWNMHLQTSHTDEPQLMGLSNIWQAVTSYHHYKAASHHL